MMDHLEQPMKPFIALLSLILTSAMVLVEDPIKLNILWLIDEYYSNHLNCSGTKEVPAPHHNKADGSFAVAEEPGKPNILFLFADDQRADTIAALGNGVIHTPGLDRLVKRGVSFDRAYMQGGMQGATCVPSRAMLLTGQSLFQIDEKLKRDPTWPQAFGKVGYTTFITGKWHNGPDSIAPSFQIGRSIFAGGMTNPMQAKLSNMLNGKLGTAQVAPKHACEVFADEAIQFIKTKHTTPFFCYVSFDAPHDPHVVPADFPVRYESTKSLLPINYLSQHPFNNGEMVIRDEELLPWPRTPDQVQRMIAEYYRYISYLDAQIGRILDALDNSPQGKNTIIVFAADSGVARGSHGLIGKQNLYEHSIRVPLIIAGPRIPIGKRTEAMCYLFDVMPTLGILCGVPAPASSQGKEFSSSLFDTGQPARPLLMFAYRKVQRAVHNGRWKLICYPQINKNQLFDLRSDPNETNDLSSKTEHAAILALMIELLKKEQLHYHDLCPVRSDTPMAADWSPPLRLLKSKK